MRAREFITEQQGKLPASSAGPLQHTYYLPGIRNNDAYITYRLSTAIARVRANADAAADDMPPFASVGPFGQNAIIMGFNDSVEPVIDKALDMMEIPGGKKLIGTKTSDEPESTNNKSIVKPFKGY